MISVLTGVGITMASFTQGSLAFQVVVAQGGLPGSKSRNLPTNCSDLVRFFPSAVILIIQPFLVNKDLRISSRDEEILSKS